MVWVVLAVAGFVLILGIAVGEHMERGRHTSRRAWRDYWRKHDFRA